MNQDEKVFQIGLDQLNPDLFGILVNMDILIRDMERCIQIDRGDTDTKYWTSTLREYKTQARNEVKHSLKELDKEQISIVRDYVEQILRRYEEMKIILDRNKAERIVEHHIQSGPSQDSTINKTIGDIMNEGDKIQDETEAAIKRMKGAVNEAEEIGVNTSKQVDLQIEQMLRVQERMGVIKEQNKEGRAKLKELGKGVFRDRCIQIMLLVITGLAIANIALLVIRKSD